MSKKAIEPPKLVDFLAARAYRLRVLILTEFPAGLVPHRTLLKSSLAGSSAGF